MNQRIRELAKQATEVSEWLSGNCSPDTPDLEKFAELLIQECANRATWAQDTNAKDIGGEVLKHFGVSDNSIKVGSRIQVISGFNVGAKGTVSYIQPNGIMWVMRDGASSDVLYHPEEVIGVEK